MGKGPMLFVDPPTGKPMPLEGTNNEKFGWTQTGYSLTQSDLTGQFSRDKREFVVFVGNEILTWNARTGKRVRRVKVTLPKDAEFYTSGISQFSPDARLLLVRTDSGVSTYNTRNGQRLYSRSHTEDILAQFSHSGHVVWGFQSVKPRGVRSWFCDALTGRALWTVRTSSSCWPVELQQGNSVVMVDQNQLQLRNIDTGRLQLALPGPTSTVSEIKPSPDGTQIWTSQNNGQIWAWRLH